MGSGSSSVDVSLCPDLSQLTNVPQLIDITPTAPAIKTVSDPNYRIHYVCALITYATLGTGTGTTAVARTEMRRQFQSEFADGDQAGHIVARSLGGHTNKDNLIIQNGRCNNGRWKNCELTVKNKLQQYENCGRRAVVFYAVGMRYPMDWSFGPNYRPERLYMRAHFYTEDRSQLLETYTCQVTNPSIGDCMLLDSEDTKFPYEDEYDELG